VDCQTYVETVLAMANAKSVAEAKNILDDIRYKGEPSFENRNHFNRSAVVPGQHREGLTSPTRCRSSTAARPPRR